MVKPKKISIRKKQGPQTRMREKMYIYLLAVTRDYISLKFFIYYI